MSGETPFRSLAPVPGAEPGIPRFCAAPQAYAG